MRTLIDHLATYAAYHRDRRNIFSHFIGIPLIVLGVVVLLSRPGLAVAGFWLSPAVLLVLVAGLFYLRLDLRLGLTMTALLMACLAAGQALALNGTALWVSTGLGLFVLGWVIQFIGHYYEGRKPAFIDDLMGLAIGPLFVVAELAFLLGWRKALEEAVVARAGPTGVRQRKTASS
ncbi:MAG: Mpo1-like protein [Pseudomonadota bacterium]